MDQGIGLFEECYYVNPFIFNIPRIGNFLIVRYACDWKLVTLEGDLYVAALGEGGPEAMSLAQLHRYTVGAPRPRPRWYLKDTSDIGLVDRSQFPREFLLLE